MTERHYINRKLVVPDYRAAAERVAPGSSADDGLPATIRRGARLWGTASSALRAHHGPRAPPPYPAAVYGRFCMPWCRATPP